MTEREGGLQQSPWWRPRVGWLQIGKPRVKPVGEMPLSDSAGEIIIRPLVLPGDKGFDKKPIVIRELELPKTTETNDIIVQSGESTIAPDAQKKVDL